MKEKKKIAIFDLDETLIHATKDRLDFQEDFQFEDFYVYKRPFVSEFLLACSKLCSIAIWSSADDEYVESICSQLVDDSIDFEFVWGRSECWVKIVKVQDQDTGLTRKEHQNIKPLEKVRRKGFQMSNLLIIDDSHFKVKDNPGNYFIIEPFEGNQEDQELSYLLSHLKCMIGEGHFKSVQKDNWREGNTNSRKD